MHDYSLRYRQYCERLEQQKLDGFLLTHPANLLYLFNFSGSAGLALTLDGETRLMVDSRYMEQAEQQAVNCRPELTKGPLLPGLSKSLKGSQRIGFESRSLTQADFQTLQNFKETPDWVPHASLVEKLRQIKRADEIEQLRHNFSQAQEALHRSWAQLQPEMRECEFAGLLEWEMRRQGAEGFSFETIVASGSRSSLPHGLASEKLIGHDPLLVDFGLRRKGYCTDLTRVFSEHEAVREIASIVREAREAALAVIRPGVPAGEVDTAARDWITQAGYGEYFGHSLGHGLGLEVHELPRIAAGQKTPLEPGMVFTLEPGIYLPGKFGVRIEDVVVVEEDGAHWISDPEE